MTTSMYKSEITWNSLLLPGVYVPMNLRWARTLTLTFVAVAIPCIRHFRPRDAPSRQGLRTLLVHPCSSAELDQRGDSRDIWLRYLSNERAFINGQPTASIAVPIQVSYITSTRFEKVVWLAADPRLSYGEVASDISNLAQRTPSLVIFLATSSETGSIDPIEMNKSQNKIGTECPPRNISGSNAVLAVE
jgi:hypothetical protein